MDGADQHVVLTVAVLPRQLASEKAVAVLMAADKPDETANDDGEAKSPLVQLPDLYSRLHARQAFLSIHTEQKQHQKMDVPII
jgi:hypothetical protein